MIIAVCARSFIRIIGQRTLPYPPQPSHKLFLPFPASCIRVCEIAAEIAGIAENFGSQGHSKGRANILLAGTRDKGNRRHWALLFASMFKTSSRSDRACTPPTANPFPQSLNSNSSDSYPSSLSQHAFQQDLEKPGPVSIAPPKNSAIIADHSVIEPIRLHQRSTTDCSGSACNLPPLIRQSPHSRTLSTSQICIVPRFDPPPHIDNLHSPYQSRQSSPTRSNRFSILTGKSEGKGGKLADWFKGESQPISIGLIPSPTKEKSDPLQLTAESSCPRPADVLQEHSMAQVRSKPAMTSRFSFFSSKAPLAKSKPPADELNDELLEMDIGGALFPDEPANPFSPASFKNLQQQAESLLSRLQAAYKERTIALRDMTAEKETLFEESEGASTRAKHLKMQLDDMTAKFAEQDQAMMNLVDDLAREKQARREEEEARKKTIRVVGDTNSPSTGHCGLSRSNTVSDSGFESEDDSSADSVFSRCNGAHSPIPSISSVSTTNSPDAYRAHEFHISTSPAQLASLRPRQGQQVTAKGLPVHTCSNCEGVTASEAWNVVGILKEENSVLKHRVGELEGALDGCLDVVGRLS